MIIDTDKIRELLSTKLTGYTVEKMTKGKIKQQMYDRYRKGKSTIDRMPLQTAVELMKLINNREEDS